MLVVVADAVTLECLSNGGLGHHMVIVEKTGLCRQIDGPISSYCCLVWHTLWNSGVEASIEPPNLLTQLPL